jgi:hypothetical protein
VYPGDQDDSHVVHADETGWRIGRLNAWLWVFSSQEVTIYAIRPSRGHDVPEDILGPDFDGYLVVDGLKSYDVLEVAKGRNAAARFAWTYLAATARPPDTRTFRPREAGFAES